MLPPKERATLFPILGHCSCRFLVARVDATNTTRERRAWIKSMIDDHKGQPIKVRKETGKSLLRAREREEAGCGLCRAIAAIAN